MSARLAVIDAQRVFADPDSPWCAPRFAEALEPLRRLVDAYDPDVAFTRFVAPSTPAGSWRDYYNQWPFALQPPDAELYELVDEFAGRPTLDATTFGKWDALSAGPVVDELVVAGVSTDCCVIATALAAADAGVRVRVAADACAGASDESHEQALAILRLFAPLVEVTTVEALLRDECGRAGNPDILTSDNFWL